MSGWNNFLIAQVGASAALAGLVFVGILINLTRILSTGSLPEYALQALVLLLAVLAISSLLLAPQPLTAAGIELLLAGVADAVILLFLVIYSRRKIDPRYLTWARRPLPLGMVMNGSSPAGEHWLFYTVSSSFAAFQL